MKKLSLILLALALLPFVPWRPAAQEQTPYLVIANPENPTTELSRTQVSRFLLKKSPRWVDGTPAKPVDQGDEQAVREAFTREIHGRSVASVRHFWQRQVFSGKDLPPPEVAGDEAVVAFVKDHPGAIGYVSAEVVVEGVKVLEVTE